MVLFSLFLNPSLTLPLNNKGRVKQIYKVIKPLPLDKREGVGDGLIKYKTRNLVISLYNNSNKPIINTQPNANSLRTKIVFITFTQTFFECWLINLLPKG
jgi:hypothetical protein